MIAVSMGDPNGVGPEIALKTVPKLNRETALVLVGDRNALSLAADRLKLKVPVIEIESLEEHRMDSSVYLLHTEGPLPLEVSPGKLDAAAGAASAAYVEAATVMARKDQVSAIVTLPVNKEAVRFSLPDFTGHTGFIADLCGVSSSVMLLVSDRLAVSHVSTHCSLADAVARTKKERVFSAHEVANICGVVNQTAINWIDKGHLEAYSTPGGQYRVYADVLAKFLQKQGMRLPDELKQVLAEQSRIEEVLIVDDDSDFNELMRQFLVKRYPGFKVNQAFDGYDAGRQILVQKPDLIILDIKLRPIILAVSGESGESGDATESAAMEAGADAFLHKPIELDTLPVTIEQLAQSRATRRE